MEASLLWALSGARALLWNQKWEYPKHLMTREQAEQIGSYLLFNQVLRQLRRHTFTAFKVRDLFSQ